MDSSPSRRDRVNFGLFVAMLGLLLADNNLMAPNLSAIGQEFGFTRAEIDQKLGADINVMFWLLGGTVTLLAGYLTDRADLRLSRKRLLIALVVLGQGACLLSGLAQSYPQLYWARTCTALGMGAAGPVIGSLLADHFAPTHRPRALALLNLACSLGIGGGQFLAGALGSHFGWRMPFLVIAVLGLLVSALYGLLGQEPARGQHEPGLQALRDAGLIYQERLRLRDVPAILRVRTNVLSLLGSLLEAAPYSVLMVYLNDYLAQDRGLGVMSGTLVIMVIGGGGVLGNIISGALVQRLLISAPYKLPILCGLTSLGVAVLAELLLWIPTQAGAFPILPLLLASLLGVVFTLPSANPMLMNTNHPAHRGGVASLSNLFGDLGRGLGAWAVGLLAASLGRTVTFQCVFLLLIPSALLSLLLVRAFPREQQAVQLELRELARRRTLTK
jgi:predicted MFS family arabinose efflux permease